MKTEHVDDVFLSRRVGTTDMSYRPLRHGIDCKKAEHLGGGYLHAATDDSPYDVDGCVYCGRCHSWIWMLVPERAPEPTMCGCCDYEEADGSLIAQCKTCKAADAHQRPDWRAE